MRISIVIDNFNIFEGMPKLHENNPKKYSTCNLNILVAWVVFLITTDFFMFWTIIIWKTIVKIPLNIDMVEFQKHYIQETNNICKNIKGSPSGVKAKPWSPVVCCHLGSMCLTWRQEISEQAFMSYLVSGVPKFDIKNCSRSCLKSCARTHH
jgi:hypothetical protein